MRSILRPAALSLALAATLFLGGASTVADQANQSVQRPTETFAGRIAALSEPGGYFNTDNLISNERSYLHVAPALRALSKSGGRGGVYLGVGPDQNFSYIAHVRPSLALLVDVRRDNLLLHLLFKALFAEARTRVEYLALLSGRDAPREPAAAASIEAIIKAIDNAKPLASAALSDMRRRIDRRIQGFGVPMTDAERATIASFHQRFIDAGLSLQFNTTGRAPQVDYPTYRDLLLEVDRNGVRQSFLASDADFQFVKDLQARDLVIPIVGNLSGPTALAAVAKYLTASNQKVAAFYTSNVEFYLFRDGTFPAFVQNLSRLPLQPGALIVRSIFPSGGTGLPLPPGYNSASITRPIQALIEGYQSGGFRQYRDLVR